MNLQELKRGLIEWKDFSSELTEQAECGKFEGWDNLGFDGQKTLFLEVFDDSLKTVGVLRGDFLEFTPKVTIEDIGRPFLFIVLLSTSDYVVRFITDAYGDEFVLTSANLDYPEIVCSQNDIQIVGKVVEIWRLKLEKSRK